MKTSKILLTIIAAVATAGFACQQAQAVPITGMLNIGGTADFNSNELELATSATFSNVTVQGGNTGTFMSFVVGSPVTMAAYTFIPSTMTNGLWTVNGFTFNLTSSTVDTQNSKTLSISGTGTITGPAGFDATPGVWQFTSQSPGGIDHSTFSFSAGTQALGVPDNGMTVMLLGAGLLGLAVFHAKLAKTAKV
jgi:hypothetical protein